MLNEFLKWAEQQGWHVIANAEPANLPEALTDRYGVPAAWYRFIGTLQVCENPTATTWFLTPQDYLPHEGAFQWNEFELQSLEYADDADSVTVFWNRHLPIVLSVGGEYAYYALDTQTGEIVSGCEPEYEEAETVAADFDAFIRKIIAGEIAL